MQRYFVAGLATLLPVAVTLYLLAFVFKFADGLLGRYINRYWLRTYGYEIPGLGLVMTVLLILAVGMLSSYLFGQVLLRNLEGWFSRLPVIRRVYPSVKQMAGFLFAKEKQQAAFRRVVMVQYPRPGCYSLAFVTNESAGPSPQGGLLAQTGKPMLTLLIPTPPSPWSGPLIFVPKEETIPLDISIEDTFKLIVSGGVLAPTFNVSTHP